MAVTSRIWDAAPHAWGCPMVSYQVGLASSPARAAARGVHCRRGDNEHHHGLLIAVGVWRSVSFMYHGGTGCNYVMRCDLYGGLAAPLLRCGGEVRGMKSLCSCPVLKCGVW